MRNTRGIAMLRCRRHTLKLLASLSNPGWRNAPAESWDFALRHLDYRIIDPAHEKQDEAIAGSARGASDDDEDDR